jgi:Spy/CpxP family protein refolding chaperone
MRWPLAVIALVPLIAWAEVPGEPGDDMRVRVEHRVHLMRLVELSERLGLSDDKAMQINKELEQFDERRRKVGESTREARKIVKRAADGDAAAQKQLDQAVDQLMQARKAQSDIDADQYRTISKELTPEQRAKFVLFIGEFRHRMERLANEAREHGPRDSPDDRP